MDATGVRVRLILLEVAEIEVKAGAGQRIDGTTTAVGSCGPDGASPYGCEDMVGNVQEWTSTGWGSRKDNPDYVYPYRPDDGREDPETTQAVPGLWRVHRGGSYREDAVSLRCTARGASAPDSRLRWRGFRVAMDI